MKKGFYIPRLFIFWLLVFALFRLTFEIIFRDELTAGHVSNALIAFAVGLRMDISAACYLMLFPFLLVVITSLSLRYFNNPAGRPVVVLSFLLSTYQGLVIAGVALLCIVNICLYRHVGTLLNARMLKYVAFPKEAFASVNIVVVLTLLLIWLLSSVVLYKVYIKIAGRYFGRMLKEGINTRKATSSFGLIYILLFIAGMRGGVQLTPINESMIYYSPYQVNNMAAANGLWMLGCSWLNSSGDKNPYVVFSVSEAKGIWQNMIKPGNGTCPEILNTNRPNIVIVMLESWTADVVKALGGLSGITPCFDTLRHNGLLFTNAYASGSRTDHGLVSIISGFPAQPNHSIITEPERAQKLPFVTDALYKSGYHISYYYGGDADFANMKIYLLNAHFDKIIDAAGFAGADRNGKWGANDAYVYRKQLLDLDSVQQPFFSLVMTLSSHEPFEVPTHHKFVGRNNDALRFENAIYYSDSCLGSYLADAAKQSWFRNTLFILIADHGHRLPLLRDAYSPEAHRITLMFYGGALKDEFRGKEVTKTTDQCDVAAMLYDQMQLPDSNFKWSKDVLNPTVKGFACYVNDPQAGIVIGNQHLTYLLANGVVTSYTPGAISADSLQKCARAWIQLYYQQYLNY